MASVSGGAFNGTPSNAHPSVVGSVSAKSAPTATIGQQLAAAASQHSLFSGGASGTVTFAGQSAGTADKIVATQTTHESGVTISFNDGSSLTVLGASHLAHFFGH